MGTIAGTSVDTDVVVLLARASGAALRTANAALEPLGLRARHYAALTIAAESGGVAQRQIGALLGLDPSAVVTLVDDLEGRGLVQRLPDPDDRRARLVTATADGIRLLERAGDVAREVRQAALGALSPAERETFVALLRRVVG